MANKKVNINERLIHHMRKWKIADEMLWKNAAQHQAIFVRDEICLNLLHVPSFIVSEHRSKSIDLPVYGFIMRNGIKVIMRYNFYNWVVTVEAPEALPEDTLPMELFDNKGNVCWAEGFEDRWIHGPYDAKKKKKKFTVQLYNEYRVYTMMFFLKNALPDIVFEGETRDAEEIAKSIEEIYKVNGVYEFEQDGYYHDTGKPFMRRKNSGWEMLWYTYRKLEDEERKDKLEYASLMDDSEDPKKFAERICRYQKIKDIFKMEEWFYKTAI